MEDEPASGALLVLPVPSTLRTQFEAYVRTQGVPNTEQASYVKWLRYYLDFCHKYHFPEEHNESLGHFLHKLEEKKQTKAQQQQASHAITLYDALLHSKGAQRDGPSPQTVSPPGKIPDGSSHRPLLSVHEANTSLKAGSPFSGSLGNAHSEPSRRTDSSSNSMNISTGVSWTEAYARVAQEIQVRHDAPKPLRNSRQWMPHVQTLTRSKDPH